MKRQPRFRLLLPVLLLAGLATGCLQPQHLDADAQPPYFDVRGMVEAQSEALARQASPLQKQTDINGQLSEQAIEQPNWRQELAMFADADINKPNLRSSYRIDTLDGSRLAYTALNPELRVQRLEVQGTPQGPACLLVAELQEHNPIYSSKQVLRWEMEQGRLARYRIEGFQKMRGQDTLHYHLQASVPLSTPSR
jgi:hypothetical protein